MMALWKDFPHIVEEGSISIDRTVEPSAMVFTGENGRRRTRKYNDGECIRRVRWR